MNKNERIGTVNEGYKVLMVAEFNEFGIALCERVKHVGICDFVTWEYRADMDDNYFWGHYCNDMDEAYEDFVERVEHEAKLAARDEHLKRTGKLVLS